MTGGAHPQGRFNRGLREGRRSPAGDARAGRGVARGPERAGRGATRIPTALGRGCSLLLRQLGFGRGRSGGARRGWGVSQPMSSCCLSPGRDRSPRAAAQGVPSRPPNSHLAPAGPAAGPPGPAQCSGSWVEARQVPPWAAAPAAPRPTRDCCLLAFRGTSVLGD